METKLCLLPNMNFTNTQLKFKYPINLAFMGKYTISPKKLFIFKIKLDSFFNMNR